VFFSLLIVLMTVPAEVILLRALVTPSQNQAIREWAEGLEPDALSRAADHIQSYPYQYRREIMRALSNEKRSEVWRNHLNAYLQANPQLDPAAAGLIRAASDVLTPEIFAGPTDKQLSELHAVATQLVATLGQEEAEYLLYRLGPRDGTFASFEPLSMYLSNMVRTTFIPSAQIWNCECNMFWGCMDWGTSCTDKVFCLIDNDWPMCGWGWLDPCNGMCALGW
jgi:hypothetical protein